MKGGDRMGWIQKLNETYDNCQEVIGTEVSGDVPLLPICHTTQKAQIEIVLTADGIFRRARIIPKNDARTIIPCTEESGGRTNNEAPHPLCDKLQYLAPDYSKRSGNKRQYFQSYLAQLKNWCNSEFSDPKTLAIYEYVNRGNIIGDLIKNKIFFSDESGVLLPKIGKNNIENKFPIFDVLTSQADAFIRWEVEVPGILETKVWRDKDLWNKWIDYYTSLKRQKSLCYVTGREELISKQHPAKIRNDGDKAKIISSNDNSGFTFRGRFTNAEQAAAAGFRVTQKAHFALRWLISKQGYRKADLAIVAWATSGAAVPKPTDDTLSILGMDDLSSDVLSSVYTAQNTAIKLRNRIAGYGKSLGDTAEVVVMSLDSATTGRLAITYYRELFGSNFLQRINDWHESCAWIHGYRTVDVFDERSGKNKKKQITFVGAPAPDDIAEAAYGNRVDEKLRKMTVERILPCIVDGQQIPRDLVESTVRRATIREGKGRWEWEKTLSIACALYKKYHRKENYQMTLEEDRRTRDYLYGRLLALAENLEQWALKDLHEKRSTNAERLMQRFAERPYSTWRTIELSLNPYIAKLGGKSIKKKKIIDEVIASFNPREFMNDKRLSGEFLLGYHCQRQALYASSKQSDESVEESEEK